jgi:hypothetical protein
LGLIQKRGVLYIIKFNKCCQTRYGDLLA